jgi:hypothetical protein
MKTGRTRRGFTKNLAKILRQQFGIDFETPGQNMSELLVAGQSYFLTPVKSDTKHWLKITKLEEKLSQAI